MRRAESRYERLEQLERLLASRPAGWRTGDLAELAGAEDDQHDHQD